MAGLADKTIMVTFDDNQNAFPVVSNVQANPDIVDANGAVALSGMATDPDPTPDTLSLEWTATPNIGTFSDANALTTTWTAPSPTDNDRPVTLTLTATEPDENLTGSASVNVTVRGNQAPTVTAVADVTTVDVGDTVSLTATAVDPEGESMTYSWTSDLGGDFGTPTALTTTWEAPTVTESTVVSLTFTANDGVRSRSIVRHRNRALPGDTAARAPGGSGQVHGDRNRRQRTASRSDRGAHAVHLLG